MSEDSIASDSLLDLCRDQHRRIVLGTLLEEQRSLTLNDLTTAILEYNHQMPITEASEEVLTEIRIWLYHVHVPKLAAEGLVEYDSDRRLVEPTEELERAQPALSAILDADSSLEAPMEL
jgi:hypothetical protein